MLESNNNIDEILASRDFVKDEYHNYYEVVGTTTEGGKVIQVVLSHAYFGIGFSRLIISELDRGYKEHDYIGKPIRDILRGHIEVLESAGRKIFTIDELLENGTEVKLNDITKEHPREKR